MRVAGITAAVRTRIEKLHGGLRDTHAVDLSALVAAGRKSDPRSPSGRGSEQLTAKQGLAWLPTEQCCDSFPRAFTATAARR